MSSVKDIKTRISLDGEKAFKSSLKSVNSELKVLASEVKAVSSSFDKSKATAQNYKDVNAALSKQIEQQKVKCTALEGAVADCKDSYEKAKQKAAAMAEEFGKNSEQAKNANKAVQSAEQTMQKYETQLNNARSELNKLNAQYNQNESAIKRLDSDNAKLNKSTKDVSNSSSSAKNALGLLSKIDFSALAGSVSKVSAALGKITSASIKALTSEVKISMQAFAGYETAVAGTAIALAKGATTVGASFETSMSKVQGLKGLSKDSEDYQKLSEAAQAMGKSTSKTAAESADALGYMALAGWETEEMLTGLEPILRGSEAWGSDLATTSDLVTDSMSAFGRGTSELTHFLDAVTAAQNNSNTSATQMLEAYIGVGGMFNTLGVGIEESASILGILANRGKKGSEAGNNLNSILINLIGANKKASTAMNTLGVSAWDQNGNFIGLTETLKILNNALNNSTQKQKAMFESAIGGKTQFDTLNMLLEGVSNEYGELYEKIENCDGVLNQTAETMMDNVQGAFIILQSAIQGLGISGFEMFSDELKSFIQRITDYVTLISDAFDENGFQGVSDFFDVFKNILVQDIKKIIPEVTSAYETYSSTFNKIMLDMLDVNIDVAPVIFDDLIPVMTGSFNRMVEGIAERIPDMMPLIAQACTELLTGVLGGAANGIAIVSRDLSKTLNATMPVITDSLGSFLPFFADVGLHSILNMISGIESYITSSDFITTANNVIQSLASSLELYLPLMMDSGINILKSLIDGIMQVLPTLLNASILIVSEIGNDIVSNLDYLLDTALQLVIMLSDSLIANIPALVDTAIDIVLSLAQFLSDNASLLIDSAVLIVTTLCDELLTTENIELIVNSALDIVMALVQGVADNLEPLIACAAQIIEELMWYLNNEGGLETIITTAVEIVGILIKGLIDSIDEGKLTEFASMLLVELGKAIMELDFGSIGEDIVNGIMQGMMGVPFDAQEFENNFADNWVSGMKDILGIHSPSTLMRDEIGVYLVPGMVEGIADTSNLLTDEVNNVVNGLVDNVDTEQNVDLKLLSNIATNADEMQNSLSDIIPDIESSDYYTITFSSNIDEIANQINEISDKSAKVNLFTQYSADDIEHMANLNVKNNTPDNMIDMIYQKLSDIENDISNLKLTVNTSNYLYPNSMALRDTILEVNLVNDSITGGR